MRINKPYTNQDYARLAIYCNANNCHIEDKGDYLEAVENVAPVLTKEQIEQARADLYCSEVDPMMSEYNRKKTFNLFKEGEEEALLKAIEDKVAEIKENNPYPVEESEEVIEDGLQRKEKEVEEPLVELYSMEI